MPHMCRLIDYQTFDLVEHRRMCGVVISTECSARHYDADGRFFVDHSAYLNWGCMRSQHFAFAIFTCGKIEGVVVLASRVFRGDI